MIVYFTIPNVQLNGDELLPKSQFWSGDWKSYENVDDSQFDVIITSETIYNPQSYQKLHDVIRKKLKPGGSAYPLVDSCNNRLNCKNLFETSKRIGDSSQRNAAHHIVIGPIWSNLHDSARLLGIRDSTWPFFWLLFSEAPMVILTWEFTLCFPSRCVRVKFKPTQVS